jgi:hypothetical protein
MALRMFVPCIVILAVGVGAASPVAAGDLASPTSGRTQGSDAPGGWTREAVAALLAPGQMKLISPVLRATGAECPVTSHSYCPDQFPYCCYAPKANQYYCAVNISGCTKE